VHDNSGVANKAAYLISSGTKNELGGSFNGQTFPGTGNAKMAKVFYRALRTLSSGADFADLAGVLNQSCNDLIGTSGFAKSTCETVRKAVLATEMAEQPTGLAAPAAAPEATFCPTGLGRKAILFDGFESFSTRRWALGGFWGHIGDYARTGRYSVYGVEPDYATSSAITLNPYQRIPRGVRTFLRFAHQYRLDAGPELTGPFYDGARLELRTSGGSWASASGRYWQNGPTKTINPTGNGSTDTYTAFGGDSRGYTSSKVEMSSLAGKSVQMRWRLISDRMVAVDGWTIDDVYLFACGGAKPSDVDTITVTPGSKKVTVKWTAPVWAGTGGVTAYKVAISGKPAVKVSKSARTKVFRDLKPGKKYTFTVRAVAALGDGPGRTLSAVPKR
jgi:bacillolysin